MEMMLTYVPASALVQRAQNVTLKLLALGSSIGISDEGSAVVVDDVVLVLARLANTGEGKGEDVVLVWIVLPRHIS
jgi:hypothetical protein